VRAAARIVAVAEGGVTRLAQLRGEVPLLPRRTGGPGTVVHLVGGAAGPLRGDDLTIDVEVGPGAELTVRTVAASVALPGPPGPPSTLRVRAQVAPGARLRWLPEPLIAATGCDHHAVTTVAVAAGGRLAWRDDLVCGRHAEYPGDARIDTTIRYAHATVYRSRLAVGPAAPGWDSPAVLGRARAAGTLVLIDEMVPQARSLGPGAAVMPLVLPAIGDPTSAVLVQAVGADMRAVRASLDPLTAANPAGIRTTPRC
jgi:urease accessory protein